jgi:WD40 repeat protein
MSLAIAPDNKLVLTSSWGRSVATKLADGRTRYSAAKNQMLRLIDLKSGKTVRAIELPDSSAGPVTFSPDGHYFAAGIRNVGAAIRIWKTTTGDELLAISGFEGNPATLAISADHKLLVSGMSDTTALVWDVAAALSRKPAK